MRAFSQEIGHEIDRHRAAHVIRVGLKGETPDSDFFLAQNPERISDRFKEALFLPAINALHFLQQIKWHTQLFADGHESGEVFWKTRTSVSYSSVEKIATDAPVRPDSTCHFFDIRAAALTDG